MDSRQGEIMIKCGFGEKIITPPLGTPCSLGVDDEAEEIFDDIYTRAICLRDRNKILFIISAEVISLSIEDIGDIKNAISKAIDIKDFQIVVHTTHTHQAPLAKYHIVSPINRDGYRAISEEYYHYFLEQNAKAAKQALENLAELDSIGYGESEVQKIESNRRIVTQDGKIIMRSSRPSEELKKYPEGHIDPKVRIFLLRRRNEKDIVWINYHGHPASTGGDEAPFVTGDFPGWAIHLLKEEIPEYNYIYMTGPHGNLNPGKYTTGDPKKIEDRKKDRNRMGKILAEGVKRALKNLKFSKVKSFNFLKEKLFLELNPDWPSKEELEKKYQEALKEIKEVHSQGKKVISGGSIRWVQFKRYAYSILVNNKMPSFVSALKIGGYYAVFFPNEIFLEASDKIRRTYPERKMLTFSMCDDAYSYIPTPEAYTEGGYETSVSRFAPPTFNIVVNTAEKLLKEL